MIFQPCPVRGDRSLLFAKAAKLEETQGNEKMVPLSGETIRDYTTGTCKGWRFGWSWWRSCSCMIHECFIMVLHLCSNILCHQCPYTTSLIIYIHSQLDTCHLSIFKYKVDVCMQLLGLLCIRETPGVFWGSCCADQLLFSLLLLSSLMLQYFEDRQFLVK